MVYGSNRWLFWALAVPVVANARKFIHNRTVYRFADYYHSVLGLSSNFALIGIDHDPRLLNGHLATISFDITAAWGWFTFGIHTALTGAIITKIV